MTTPTDAMGSVIRRLAASSQRDVFVVRGGLVTATYVAPHPRPAADVDFLADLPFDRSDLLRRLQDVLAADVDDDVTLDVIHTEVIWEETELPGLRAQLACGAGDLQVDIGVGDPLVDGPIEREILGTVVSVCRPETLFAWKVHGLFERGPGKWRAKDLHDIDLLIRFATLDPALIAPSLRVAFDSRGDSFRLADRLLRGEFGRSRGSRRKWRRFDRDRPPGVELDDLPDVLARVIEYLRPYLDMPGPETG